MTPVPSQGLIVRGLTVTAPWGPVVRGVDVDLEPGRITGLVGESGSGKTMMVRALMGLLPRGWTSGGRASLDGEDLMADPSSFRGSHLGMVFHAHELHAEAITCYRRALELSPSEARWSYLAALATRKSDLGASIGDFERAVDLGFDKPALFVTFGDTLLQLGQPERAADQYRRRL